MKRLVGVKAEEFTARCPLGCGGRGGWRRLLHLPEGSGPCLLIFALQAGQLLWKALTVQFAKHLQVGLHWLV